MRGAFEYLREVAASRTRETYAKSNSSMYVPVAVTGPGALCIFNVSAAGVQLRVIHCTRLLAAFASPHLLDDDTKDGRKLAEGAYSLESRARATGEEGASRLLGIFPPYIPYVHLSST